MSHDRSQTTRIIISSIKSFKQQTFIEHQVCASYRKRAIRPRGKAPLATCTSPDTVLSERSPSRYTSYGYTHTWPVHLLWLQSSRLSGKSSGKHDVCRSPGGFPTAATFKFFSASVAGEPAATPPSVPLPPPYQTAAIFLARRADPRSQFVDSRTKAL